MVLGEPAEHPGQGGEVHAGAVDAAGQQRGERVALGGHALGLRERLPHQAPAPQGEPAADAVVLLDRAADPVDHEVGVAGVGEGVDDQLAGAGVEVGCAIST